MSWRQQVRVPRRSPHHLPGATLRQHRGLHWRIWWGGLWYIGWCDGVGRGFKGCNTLGDEVGCGGGVVECGVEQRWSGARACKYDMVLHLTGLWRRLKKIYIGLVACSLTVLLNVYCTYLFWYAYLFLLTRYHRNQKVPFLLKFNGTVNIRNHFYL